MKSADVQGFSTQWSVRWPDVTWAQRRNQLVGGKWFSSDMFVTLLDAGPETASEIGGKASNCARLLRAGFPVPPGLVILASAADGELAHLQEHPWIVAQPATTRFAVRSSGIGEDGAGHSFAGIHETLLNVAPEDLAAAALACRRSVASAPAQAYRRTRQLRDDARTGVLVQPMIGAAVSGVAFTINPVTAADEIVVNAVKGLGDALVSGLVEPDEFRVRKIDRALLSTHLARRELAQPPDAVLTSAMIDELAGLLLRMERHYEAPQDVEWCHDGERLWILQSRPITTAAAVSATVPAVKPAVDIEWTRANLAEVFPDQLSPQALDAYERMLNDSQRRFMGRVLLPEAEWGAQFKSFYGRLYFNLTQLRHVARLSGAPESGLLRSLGHADAITPADEVRARPPLREILKCLPDLLRLARNDLSVSRAMRRHEQWVESTIGAFRSLDPPAMTDAAIWKQIESWRRVGPDHMQLVLTLGGMLFREDALRKAFARVGQPYEALVYPQLAAGARSVSTEQAFALIALAEVARQDATVAEYLRADDGRFHDFRGRLSGSRFLVEFEQFLERYGHRGHYESDWALPRYREDPTPLLFAIRAHVIDPSRVDVEGKLRRLEAEAAAAWRSFDARLTAWQRWTLGRRVRNIIGELKRRYVMREKVRSNMTRLLFYVRQWHLTLADRFVERGWIDQRDDYFMIQLDEVASALRDSGDAARLRAIASSRAQDLRALATLSMPLLMHQSDVERIGQRSRNPALDRSGGLQGLCVSPGVAEAEVVVIRDPRDFRLMRAGAILVAPATDPSWTPLFTLAAGVIVEVGGMLSHASTVAREYGLPALANVKDATRRLQSGERIRLDATAGQIFRLPAGTECPRTEAP
jgi:phosphohistidine swiveling domain-containing protein